MLSDSTHSAEQVLRAAQDAGIDLADIAAQLERRPAALPAVTCSRASNASSAPRHRGG
jgi:hypothetical protein